MLEEGEIAHQKALDFIAQNPEKFKIPYEGIIHIGKEDSLRDDNGIVIAEPDLVFEYLGEVHIVEYKRGGVNNFKPARDQLVRAAAWYARDRNNLPLRNIHTHIILESDRGFRETD